MSEIKVGVVGTGSIAQLVHLPILKKMEGVKLQAICDLDESKMQHLLEKFQIPSWYRTVDQMIKSEELDAIFICTTSLYHFPMSYLALKNNLHVFVEKPLALKTSDALKLDELAEQKKLTVVVGMQNRFRDDVKILRNFMENDELGEIFYIKSGWLRRWNRSPLQSWQVKKEFAGGGVLIDMGTQLIDLALYLTGMPEIRSVRLYDYTLNPDNEVEDAALVVLEMKSGMTVTIEISWRMHLENDMIYTHIFGKNGAAYLNPLRIHKELHGNLVNVTPVLQEQNSAQRFTMAYENEIRHFFKVIRGEEENNSSIKEALQTMRIIEALYESARLGKTVEL
jgi:predicted dehydrogenase